MPQVVVSEYVHAWPGRQVVGVADRAVAPQVLMAADHGGVVLVEQFGGE
ncbi:MAG: hypothetical protein QOC83_5239, partial [Pseudonocardiales bacterium]|nr:hypothetical protein [Pseudonocardiales bacterium]